MSKTLSRKSTLSQNQRRAEQFVPEAWFGIGRESTLCKNMKMQKTLGQRLSQGEHTRLLVSSLGQNLMQEEQTLTTPDTKRENDAESSGWRRRLCQILRQEEHTSLLCLTGRLHFIKN